MSENEETDWRLEGAEAGQEEKAAAPTKEDHEEIAPYLNPNERKVNQQIKSYVCANRFYEHIEKQKAAASEYLDKRFGRWNNDI
jgi:hypothetical protein